MTSEDRAGDLVDLAGRYAIDATIGTGGMASVARGHDRETNRAVALKRLHEHLADDPHFEKILLDEARLQTIVRHPNVVATLAIGRMEGRLTLVLELVEGSSLARLLQLGGALDPAMVVEIGCQILAGLAAAHGATDEEGHALDLVHRDVSPPNVLVDREGAVKLADFGIARARSRLQTTTEGRIKGKLAYMSPEQIEGHVLDARSDLFSTGVVLWELLTGTRLFYGESEGELVRKVTSRPIPRASTIRADVPASLDDVLARALSRDPADRFQSANEMSAALEAAHPRAGAAALAKIAPEPPSAVHVVSKDTSAFAPTAEHAGEKVAKEPHTEIVSRTDLRPKRSRRAVAYAGLGVVAVAAAIVVLRPPPESPSASASAFPSASAIASASAVTSASAIALPSTTPSASASTPTASSSMTVARPRPSVRPIASAPASASSSAPRPSCDPPYRVDAQGVRVFKPECL